VSAGEMRISMGMVSWSWYLIGMDVMECNVMNGFVCNV